LGIPVLENSKCNKKRYRREYKKESPHKKSSSYKLHYLCDENQNKPRQFLAFRRTIRVLTNSMVWQEFNFGKLYSA